jgi:Alpha-tubulin suppressor and related RCC1 domain-containing proteins
MSHNKLSMLATVATFTLAGCGSIIDPSSTYNIPRAVTLPTVAANGMHFTSVTSGFFHSCALDANGKAWCWGDNLYRQTGQSSAGDPCDQTSTCTLTPAAVETAVRFAQISAGVTQTCGVALDGTAWCWGGGYGGKGILGDGRMTQSAVPVAVLGGLTFKNISVGGRLTCALGTDARVFCWGSGGYVGDGKTSDALSPVEVAGGLRYLAVSAGVTHACAVTVDHVMYCWGSNQLGELGIGTLADPNAGTQAGSTAPVRVLTSLRFQSVTAGG